MKIVFKHEIKYLHTNEYIFSILYIFLLLNIILKNHEVFIVSFLLLHDNKIVIPIIY
jgi:hypothetical protein